MKRRNILATLFSILLLSLLAMAQSSPMSQSNQGGDEQKLKDIESRWADAAKSGDTNTVSSFLSDKFISTDSDGSMHTRSEALDRMKKEKITSSAVSDVQVHMVDANTAIVTGTWTGSGTNSNGKPFNTTERWTDTFVKENGEWKAVATESTSLAKKPS